MNVNAKTFSIAYFWLAFSLLSFSGSSQAQGSEPSAEALFAPIAEVLRHPRCLNCHTVTDFPRQTDERKRHAQLIIRGEDGNGAPTLQCAACHQDRNVLDGKMPGAPHWHLAPLSMGWEGLNDSELCEALKDTEANGDRSPQELIEHVENDALVLWGFNPGGERSLPPLSHEDFVDAVRAWVAADTVCP